MGLFGGGDTQTRSETDAEQEWPECSFRLCSHPRLGVCEERRAVCIDCKAVRGTTPVKTWLQEALPLSAISDKLIAEFRLSPHDLVTVHPVWDKDTGKRPFVVTLHSVIYSADSNE